MQVTSDQMRGMLTFSIDTGSRPAWTRNAGRSRSALKPTCTVKGEMNRSARETILFELRKWLRNTKRPPGRQTPPHFVDRFHRVRHDANGVGRVNNVEQVVRKRERFRIHLQQPDVGQPVSGDAPLRILEHRLAEIDTGHATVPWIQRCVDPGAHTDLQHPITGTDAQPPDRLEPAGMQRRTVEEVVDRRDLLVYARDEVGLDR